MPALNEDQLDTLRTNATEQQPAPTIRISLYTTNRKIDTPTNTSIERDTDITHNTIRTDTHALNPDDTITDQIHNQNNTTVHTNASPTTDYAPEHNVPPTQDNTAIVPDTQDTTSAQYPANYNQGQLITQHFQRIASNTKYKPIQGGKGQVHKLRPTASTKTKTDNPPLILSPQRIPISHHSSQQRMERQIQKIQQQSKAPSRHTQTPSDTHQNPTLTSLFFLKIIVI